MTCESCAYLKEQLAREQERSDKLTAQLIALADPLAHARINATNRPPAAPRPASDAPPQGHLKSPGQIRAQYPDVPSEEEREEMLRQIKAQREAAEAAMSVKPPATEARSEIEASFERFEAS